MTRAVAHAAMFALTATVMSSCARPEAPLPATCQHPRGSALPTPLGPYWTRNVILIAIDGVRWKEIFLGIDPRLANKARLEVISAPALLPNIYRRMVNGGVALGAPQQGATVCATGPEFISLPAYQELLGGRPVPSCTSNSCAPLRYPTLLDQARARVEQAEDVAAIASWDRMERATSMDNRAIAVSVGRHHGRTRDRVRVSDCASTLLDQAASASSSPGHGDYRADRYTAALALEYLVVRKPRLFFIGLGDTDEHGHARNYRAHTEALQQIDAFIGALFDALDGLGSYGAETTVLLTADHGWSKDFECHGSAGPESGRVWLLAAGGSVPAKGIVAASRPYLLSDIAPTIRHFLDLPRDTDPSAGGIISELLPSTVAGGR